MTAPLWAQSSLYFPGDIVQPITVPATTPVAVTNPGFETGTAAGWTLGGATALSTADKFTGTYSITFTGTGGLTDTVQAAASAVQVGQSITASVMYQQGAASAGHNGGRVMLVFYTAGMVAIGTPSLGNLVDSGSGGAWGQSSVTAVAPDTAAFVKLGVRVNRTNASASWADDFAWNHVAQAPAGLVFKAVQASSGLSGTPEPAWPNTVGLTVVDNEVTWEAIAATRVEWTAAPILVSGASQPTWPTQIGEFVADGSIKWEAFSRRVEDENCPNTKVVAIVGSKVHASDRDIGRFCATANPLDWTSERDAGYLPLGLQQANANDFNTGVFNQYRGNLVAFNASSFQNWQADPDPAAMALLDQMDGIGSTWQQAAQPVANDLFYLAALGVRTVGIAGGSTNLQAGDVGMPIDPLVKDAVRVAVANSSAVRSTYYPSSGQYWLAFSDYPPSLPSITGDAPNGLVGSAGSGSYTVSGGVVPYGPITVLSGTAPPGFTLNPDGTYSYAYTTAGSYSFTVGGIDADDVPFSTPDTVEVTQGFILSTGTQVSPTEPVAAYLQGASAVWTSIPRVTIPDIGIPVFAEDTWLVVDNATHYSTNLTAWSTGAATGITPNCAAYGDGILVAFANNAFRRSDNLGITSWTTIAAPFSGFNPSSVKYGNGRWVVPVQSSFSLNGPLRISTDAALTFPKGPDIPGLTFGWCVDYDPMTGRWWIGGGGGSSTTDPGVLVWTTDFETFTNVGLTGNGAIVSIARGMGGKWVAVRATGAIIYTANDWQTFGTSATTVPQTTHSQQIIHDGTYFIVGDNNGLAAAVSRRSLDGNNWQAGIAMPENDTIRFASNIT